MSDYGRVLTKSDPLGTCSRIKGNKADLILHFAKVRAIRTFWDGDGDASENDPNPPRCSGKHAQYIWPLSEIERSKWLASGAFATSIAIVETVEKVPLRHYRILTLERSLDVLARGEIIGEWVKPIASAD